MVTIVTVEIVASLSLPNVCFSHTCFPFFHFFFVFPFFLLPITIKRSIFGTGRVRRSRQNIILPGVPTRGFEFTSAASPEQAWRTMLFIEGESCCESSIRVDFSFFYDLEVNGRYLVGEGPSFVFIAVNQRRAKMI